MNKKTLVDAALGLCTVGGAVFAIGASKDPVSNVVALPDAAFGILMVVGGVLTVIGAIAFMLSFLIDRIEQAVLHVVYGDIDSKYVCSHATSGDLAGLHALYERYFGEDVPGAALMGAWVARCGSAFTIVRRVVDNAGLPTLQELVGSFKLLPLTAMGVRAIDLGQATGSTFRAEHISTGRSSPAGYYIGDVVATTRFARGVVMAQLNAAVSQVVRGSTTLYARPLTPDGLRIMSKHGFVQVSDGRSPPAIGHACKLQIALPDQSVGRPKARSRRLAPRLEGPAS